MSTISLTYTFSDNTTAFGSQVNTDFQQISSWINNTDAGVNVWTIVNSASFQLNGVDIFKMTRYRRPNLVYNSATVVNIETGLDGTSGDVTILFPDGTIRTDSNTGRIQCNLAQVAALTGTAQSGLRTGSVATNKIYQIYAVKSQVNGTDIVAVADLMECKQANFATLNTNFGTNSWVYLGSVAVGNWTASDTNVVKFIQSGPITTFYNAATGTNTSVVCAGLIVATGTASGAVTASYTYAAGVGAKQVPATLTQGWFYVQFNPGAAAAHIPITDSAATYQVGDLTVQSSLNSGGQYFKSIQDGIKAAGGGGVTNNCDVFLQSWVDGALSAGVNPLL